MNRLRTMTGDVRIAKFKSFTDPVGDANGVNDQGVVSGSPLPSGAAGPADLSAADITSGQFATTFVKKMAFGTNISLMPVIAMVR